LLAEHDRPSARGEAEALQDELEQLGAAYCPERSYCSASSTAASAYDVLDTFLGFVGEIDWVAVVREPAKNRRISSLFGDLNH
jgi:hypothetical protein